MLVETVVGDFFLEGAGEGAEESLEEFVEPEAGADKEDGTVEVFLDKAVEESEEEEVTAVISVAVNEK